MKRIDIATGKLFAWGANDYGQLGLGDLKSRAEPHQIKTSVVFIAIAAGFYHSIAVSGTFWTAIYSLIERVNELLLNRKREGVCLGR